MKKKVIDILLEQLNDYCHKTKCKHCACFYIINIVYRQHYNIIKVRLTNY